MEAAKDLAVIASHDTDSSLGAIVVEATSDNRPDDSIVISVIPVTDAGHDSGAGQGPIVDEAGMPPSERGSS